MIVHDIVLRTKRVKWSLLRNYSTIHVINHHAIQHAQVNTQMYYRNISVRDIFAITGKIKQDDSSCLSDFAIELANKKRHMRLSSHQHLSE